MDDEVARILNLIETGKINAAEGAKLLEALRKPAEETAAAAAAPVVAAGERPKGLGIYIGRPGKKDVKVRIPLGLFDLFKAWPSAKPPRFQGDPTFDVGDLLARVKQFTRGGEMFTFDLDDGKTVRVVAE